MSDHQPTDEAASSPHLIELTEQPVAVIKGRVAFDELPQFYDTAFGTLPHAIAEQGAAIVGPAFGLYHGPPVDVVDLEVGFPTSAPVEPAGAVEPGTLPAGPAARSIHHGSFDGLGEAWGRLGAFIGEKGRTPGPVMWECYLTEPSPDMDPADLRTELIWPLAD